MMITQSQRDLLVWMVQSGEDTFVLVSTFGPQDSLLAGPGGEGKDREIRPSDLRELADLGLLRRTTEHGYELTNDGRTVYEQLVKPAQEARRVGF